MALSIHVCHVRKEHTNLTRNKPVVYHVHQIPVLKESHPLVNLIAGILVKPVHQKFTVIEMPIVYSYRRLVTLNASVNLVSMAPVNTALIYAKVFAKIRELASKIFEGIQVVDVLVPSSVLIVKINQISRT